ncbi:MAG: hypothetical protein ACD_75C01649G0004, partial [uncultured bacterium]
MALLYGILPVIKVKWCLGDRVIMI